MANFCLIAGFEMHTFTHTQNAICDKIIWINMKFEMPFFPFICGVCIIKAALTNRSILNMNFRCPIAELKPKQKKYEKWWCVHMFLSLKLPNWLKNNVWHTIIYHIPFYCCQFASTITPRRFSSTTFFSHICFLLKCIW